LHVFIAHALQEITMPRTRSGLPTKRSTSYRVPTDLETKIDNLLNEGKYSSQSDIITVALRFWFDNEGKTKDQIEPIAKFFETEKGKKKLKEFAEMAVAEKMAEYKKK